MKRCLMAILFLFSLTGSAFPMGLLSSGEATSSAAINASNGYLGGVLVITDGTNAATVIIYDNATAASGTKLWETVVTGSDNYGGGLFPHWIYAANGIYVSISGTGASAIVYYIDAGADTKQPLGP